MDCRGIDGMKVKEWGSDQFAMDSLKQLDNLKKTIMANVDFSGDELKVDLD